MSITNELRDYARHLHNVWYDPRGNVYTYTTMDNAPSLDAVRLDEHVLAIADRIDAENERECHEQYACGAEHGIGASIEASMIQDCGYIELPKDADGEVIRIGDMVEWIDGDGSHAMEVTYLQLTSDGWYVGVKNYGLCGASELLRHHKQPTVEDVLTDLCEHVWESALLGSTWSDSPVESYITEYAAKMRLVEGEES